MLRATERPIARRKLKGRADDPDGERPDPSRPVGEDCLPEIEHVVVLMMENHSYDCYFGMLEGRGEGFSLDADGQPIGSNLDHSGATVALRRAPSTRQVPGVPSQAWSASHIQWNDGANDGFVRSIEQTLPGLDATVPMRYWTGDDLPFYYGLAKTFPLASRWYCSCLGPTFPNRRFLVAGTANGLIDDLPFNMGDYPKAGTIFDLLGANGISWTNYHNVPSWQISLKRVIRNAGVNVLRMLGALLSNLVPSLLKHTQSKVQATADLYPLGTIRSWNHLRTLEQFFQDCGSGSLPSVSIVDPDFGACSEENPQDIALGEAFSAKAINAVMQGPAWPTTLLIWTYDEHGGYYDHVPPPPAVPPDDVAAANPMDRHRWLRFILRFTPYAKKIDVADSGPTTYDRYGFRVPAVVVSPYARADFTSSTLYDHASVLKTIERKWNLPPLTKRDAAANDVLDMLDLAAPPAFLHPPTLPAPTRSIPL